MKWKRVEENSITLFNKWFKKGDGRITEVIVKEVAYYELKDVWFGDIETGVERDLYSRVSTEKRKMNHEETQAYIHSQRKKYSKMNSIASNWSFFLGGSISLVAKSGVIGLGIGAPLQLVQQQSGNATNGFDALDILYGALKEKNGLYLVHKTINIFPPGITAPSASHIYNFYLPSGQFVFSISF